MKKVTIHDVAKRAGVSQPTVSKVINRYPNVKAATRMKVLDAIDELGFTPDEIARSMVTNRTQTIGLIVDDIANPFYAETAKWIIRRANEAGYEVILLDAGHRDRPIHHALQILLAKRVEGILIASVTRDESSVLKLAETGFPIVLYNRNLDEPVVNYVEVDNERGVRLAVQHLMDLGHRRIAYISGPLIYSTFNDRFSSYVQSLGELGIELNPDWIYHGNFEYSAVFSFVQSLMSSEDRPTGFLAASDQMAIAVMDAAASSGLSVPRDVSIIGFDNIDISSNPFIGLTTVSQQKKKMSVLAVDALLQILNGRKRKKIPVQIKLEPELIIRKTSGACLKEVP